MGTLDNALFQFDTISKAVGYANGFVFGTLHAQ